MVDDPVLLVGDGLDEAEGLDQEVVSARASAARKAGQALGAGGVSLRRASLPSSESNAIMTRSAGGKG